MSRYKSVRKAEEHEDYSIVLQEARNYEMLLSPPEVEYAARDYVQRGEKSGLPDGSTYDEKLNAPLGENLDKFCARLSREANEAWKLWTDTTGMPVITKTDQCINPISKPIDDLLLTEEDKIKYLRIKRLLFVEEATLKAKEQERVTRKISECTNFSNDSDRIVTLPDSSRYFIKREISKNEFGEVNVKETKIDRLQGKDNITIIPGVSLPDVKRVNGGPSYAERLDLIVLSDYQTSKWRRDASADKNDNFIPNVTPSDDPDFLPPLSVSSRNFNIYPPASRPYDIVFKVYTDDTKFTRWYPSGKSKDYTSLSSIQYMLQQQAKYFTKVEVDEIKVHDRFYPNCKFEIDLRVTYGEECAPNPNDYKKVDPDSKLGMWLLQKLDAEPYSFTEFSWKDASVASDGTLVEDKVVAVGYVVNHPSQGPKRVYWVYLDKNKGTIGKPAFLRKKITHPHIVYREMCYKSEFPEFKKLTNPFLATLRMSDGYYYRDKSGRIVGFDEVKSKFFELLLNKGYVYIDSKPESPYTTVILFYFIHESVATKQKRKDLFLKFNT
jgi:hypothetical protein